MDGSWLCCSLVWFCFVWLFVFVWYVGFVPLIEQIIQVCCRTPSVVDGDVLCGHFLFSICCVSIFFPVVFGC